MLTAVVQFRGGLVIDGDVLGQFRWNHRPPALIEAPSSGESLIENPAQSIPGVINGVGAPCH